MLKIINRYGHVHNCKEVNVVIVARRLSIADTGWWRVDTRTGNFFFDDAIGYNYNQKVFLGEYPSLCGGMLARRAPGALLLDYVPPEEPPSTPLRNALRIR